VRNVDLRRSSERLINDTIAFGESKQGGQLFFVGAGVQIKAQPDLLKTNWNFFGDGESSAKIQIAFGPNSRVTQRNVESGSDRAQGHARASDERFEQHVTRACAQSISSCRGMQPRFHERFYGGDIAGNAFADFAFGAKRNRSCLGLLAVTLLDWGLQRF